MTMEIVRTIEEIRARLGRSRAGPAKSLGVGLVPTMGSLHEGHLSLVRRARETSEVVVVSSFVNPTQFNDPADLAAYPRDETRDVEFASAAGADLLFAPSVTEVYPPGFRTSVAVRGLSEVLEGASRGSGHFHAVTTVVAKLLNIVQPQAAYFGQKDAQQALIVRRMVRDLDFPVEIQVCPTIREPDGLALSSRNVRIAAADRPRAVALKRGLDAAAESIASGVRDGGKVEGAGRGAMSELSVSPEYFAVVAAETLEPMRALEAGQEVLIAVAAQLGAVRLIDNELMVVP